MLRLQMMMAQRFVGQAFGAQVVQRRVVGDLRGRVRMVEDGRDAGEAFGAEDLLGVERPVRLAELRMPLTRNFTQLYIAWHCFAPCFQIQAAVFKGH